MCEICIDNLQTALDGEMAKSVPGRILIHLDDGPDVDGRLLDKDDVEMGLHASMDDECWCGPIAIWPSDTRTAAEIWNSLEGRHDAPQ